MTAWMVVACLVMTWIITALVSGLLIGRAIRLRDRQRPDPSRRNGLAGMDRSATRAEGTEPTGVY